MLKTTGLLLILLVGVVGLNACAVSEAKKQVVNNDSQPSPESVANKATVIPEKTPPKKPKKPSAEDIKNGSVKADDYDENTPPQEDLNVLCSINAYVVDKDPNGLNVREDAEPHAKIIGKIPFNKDGTLVQIVLTNFMDKMKINRAENMDGEVVFDKEGWVSANLLATSTTGYDGKGVKLYEAGAGSKVLTIVPPETEVRIVSCDRDWVRVRYKKYLGWLDADSQCGNPFTNCS